MRKEKFFTYIEKHPAAKFVQIVVIIGGFVWMLCAMGPVFSLAEVHGYGPIILWLAMALGGPSLINWIIDHIFEEHYRGELVTEYFSIYLDDDGYKVEVNGRDIDGELITGKKNIPSFIREKLPSERIVGLRKLPDGKYIYICGANENTVIFLNDNIIMEHDRIYYDRIDRIYEVKQASPVMQQNVQVPVNESLERTAPITEQGNKDTYKLIALEGQFAGQSWELDKSVMLGRDANCCQIIFAPDTAGVSRVHCEVGCKNGSLYIRDLGSSFGTTLEDGQVVNNYQEVALENSDTFRLNLTDKFMIMK